jgi:hypothetical protein
MNSAVARVVIATVLFVAAIWNLVHFFECINTKYRKRKQSQMKQRKTKLSVRYIRGNKAFIKDFISDNLTECVMNALIIAETYNAKIDDMVHKQ